MIGEFKKDKQILYVFLIFSFPIFYILGSLFLNVSLVLVSLYFFFNYFKVVEKNKLIIFFFILFSFFIINSILSYDKILSFYKSSAYLRYFFFSVGLILILSSISDKSLRLVSKLFIFLTIFLILDIFVEYIYGKDLFGNNDGAIYNRLSGPFGDEWIAGFFLLYFGFLSMGFFSKYHNIPKIFYFLFTIILIYTIYLTGERNAFFSSLIFLILITILDKKHRITFFSSFCIIVFLFILSNKFNVVQNKYSLKSINTLNVIKSEFGDDVTKKIENKKITKIALENQWIQHYLSAYYIFRENLFFGSGFRTFKSVCLMNKESKKYLCSSHPHNIYFELLSDVGLVGFLIFLFIFTIPILFFLKKFNSLDVGSKIFFVLFIVYIFPIKPHGSLFTTSFASMLWFLYSINIYYLHNEKKK
jgi:O-antigen ligase